MNMVNAILGKSNTAKPAEPEREWQHVADLIDEIGSSVSVDLLRERARHYSGYVRESALRRCAALTLPELFPVVVGHLNDWVPQVQQVAREALMALLPSTPAALALAELPVVLHLHSPGRGDHAGWLAQVEARLLEVISVAELAAAQGAEVRVARACMHVIRKHALLDQSVMIAIMLGRGDDIVLAGQAMQLSVQLPREEQVALYRQALHSHFGPVRVSALRALLDMPELERLPIATAALTDVQGAVRAVATRYLSAAGVDVRGHYRSLLQRAPMPARPTRIGLGALAELRNPDDVALISVFLKNDVESVRAAAYTAWLKLAERDKDVVARAAFVDATPSVRKFALQAVRKHGAHIPQSVIEAWLLEHDDIGTTMLFAESQRWSWLVCIAQVALARGMAEPIRMALDLRHLMTQFLHNFACFGGQISFKRPATSNSATGSAHLAESELAYNCPNCGHKMAFMGRNFATPSKADNTAWLAAKCLWEAGFRYSGSGYHSDPPLPRTKQEAAAFVEQNPKHAQRIGQPTGANMRELLLNSCARSGE